MATVLITAFEPYDRWEQNSSWLALLELTKDLPDSPRIVTRRYPVDFSQARGKLLEDLAANYDYALLLGQAPERRGFIWNRSGSMSAGTANNCRTNSVLSRTTGRSLIAVPCR